MKHISLLLDTLLLVLPRNGDLIAEESAVRVDVEQICETLSPSLLG